MNSALYLNICVFLFGMGTVGCYLNRRNFLIMLQCIEVMQLSVNLVFLTGSVTVDDLNGQQMRLWVQTAAAAETAQGQALCVQYFRARSTLDVEQIGLMKGSKMTTVISFFFLSILLWTGHSSEWVVDYATGAAQAAIWCTVASQVPFVSIWVSLKESAFREISRANLRTHFSTFYKYSLDYKRFIYFL